MLESLSTWEQRDFGGSWLLPDSPDVTVKGALFAQNCEFSSGQVSTRTGFVKLYTSTAAGVPEGVFAMFKWISELGALLVLRSQLTGVQVIDTGAAVIAPVVVDSTHTFAGNAITASFAQSGTRVTYVLWSYPNLINNAPSFSGSHPGVILKTAAGTFVADKICSPPMAYVPSAPTEPGAGVITAGPHNIGYRILDRAGYFGRPSPDSGVGTPTPQTFVPVQVTASGGKNLSITLDPPSWPVNGYLVQIVMSPYDNPNRYFTVPGATALLPVGGGALSLAITWSIDDPTLVGTRGAECTTSLDLYSQGIGGTNLLNCYHIVSSGNRLFYIVKVLDNQGNYYSQLFISDIGADQTFSIDQSFITLPGQRQITTVFDLLGNTYILGPHWTYKTSDDLDVPATWTGPFLVDGEKGTLQPRGVTVSPSGSYAWIADTSGLYYFDGTYATLPVSFLQSPDWNLINWMQAPIQVKDDPVNHRVYVLASLILGAQSSQTSILVWDYTNGFDAEQVKYSKWIVAGGMSSAMELMENSLFGFQQLRGTELWIPQPSSTGYTLLRKTGTFGAAVYHDENEVAAHNAIDWQYDTPIAPQASTAATFQGASAGGGTGGEWLKFEAAHIRTKGIGTLNTTIYSYDRNVSAALAPITMSINPGEPILRLFDMNSPGLIYHFRVNSPDEYCILSGVRTYFGPWASHV